MKKTSAGAMEVHSAESSFYFYTTHTQFARRMHGWSSDTRSDAHLQIQIHLLFLFLTFPDNFNFVCRETKGGGTRTWGSA